MLRYTGDAGVAGGWSIVRVSKERGFEVNGVGDVHAVCHCDDKEYEIVDDAVSWIGAGVAAGFQGLKGVRCNGI